MSEPSPPTAERAIGPLGLLVLVAGMAGAALVMGRNFPTGVDALPLVVAIAALLLGTGAGVVCALLATCIRGAPLMLHAGAGDTLGVAASAAVYLATGLLVGLVADGLRAMAAAGRERDSLTGLLNQVAFKQRLGQEMARARRYGHPLTVIMVDLDGFKAINDSLGHLAGDAVLRRVAELLESTLRDGVDLPARYGGDEFAVALPMTDEPGGRAVVERVRETLGATPLAATAGPPLTVHLSAGVAAFDPESMVAPTDLLAAADQRLYQDKEHAPDRARAATDGAARGVGGARGGRDPGHRPGAGTADGTGREESA